MKCVAVWTLNVKWNIGRSNRRETIMASVNCGLSWVGRRSLRAVRSQTEPGGAWERAVKGTVLSQNRYTCGAFPSTGEFLELNEFDLQRLEAAWQEAVFELYLAENKSEPEVAER